MTKSDTGDKGEKGRGEVVLVHNFVTQTTHARLDRPSFKCEGSLTRAP